MKKLRIWLFRSGMAAIIGWHLLAMGCNSQLVKNFGKAPTNPYPDILADFVYGYRIIHVGEDFPNIALKSPPQSWARTYLGLGDEKTFTIRDIDADLVLVEMFNTHCRPCQQIVPIYTDLYKRLKADKSLGNRIKMIAVGVGNTEDEINAFRETYKIPFPVVADSELDLQDAVGQPRLPFSILVRLDKTSNAAVVALTYSDEKKDDEGMYQDMNALVTLDTSVFREQGLKIEPTVNKIIPPFSQSEIESKIKSAMIQIHPGAVLTEFKKIELDRYQVYTAVLKDDKGSTRLFADVVARPSLCNVCHDVHFFYIFNENGVLLNFVPLQVTKWGNEKWSEEDVQRMRGRLIGRFIFTSFYFNPQLDAVTSATITSAVIFDELSRGDELFKLLKQKGFIPSDEMKN